MNKPEVLKHRMNNRKKNKQRGVSNRNNEWN